MPDITSGASCLVASSLRTNIAIDDGLLAHAMAITGFATKTATVEEALRRLVRRYQRQAALADMARLGWDDNLAIIRAGRDSKGGP